MTYSTEIDTVSIQIYCSSLDEQQGISFMLIRAISEYNKVYIKRNKLGEQEILFNNRKIASIRLGINPIWNKFTGIYEINYYIVVTFAGLKSYSDAIDKLSYSCLLTTCGTLNTFNIEYKFTELDICLDINSKINNVLAICTTKLPRTEYHRVNHSFYNGNTVYIEKLDKDKLNYYSQRAYVYNKAKKENLKCTLTRFELKLQKSFFFNNEFDADRIIKALDRYTVMYFQNINEKNMIVDTYNSYSRISKREFYKMNLNKYRLIPDAAKIETFINKLKWYRLY